MISTAEGAYAVAYGIRVLSTYPVSGFRIQAFTPALWDEASGINVGPQ